MKKIFTFILVLMSLAIPSIAMAAATNVITYEASSSLIGDFDDSGVFGASVVHHVYTAGVGTITFDGPVTSIGEKAFYACDALSSITLPSGVTSIGDRAFYGCDGLVMIYLNAQNPPAVGNKAFNSVPEECIVYVPCGRVSAYAGWGGFTNIKEPPADYNITLEVPNPERGNVEVVKNNACGTEIKATSNYGYHFEKWSDNNTDSVRSLTLTKGTTLIAYFGKNQYTITTQSNNPTAGKAGGDTTAYYLDVVPVSAYANFGWKFAHWADGNTDNPRVVQVERDSLFKAIFVPKSIVLKTVNQDWCDGSVYLDTRIRCIRLIRRTLLLSLGKTLFVLLPRILSIHL